MGKSKRKTPIIGWANGSDKDDKIRAHKKFRRTTKQRDWDDSPINLKEVSDVYLFQKDGKQYLRKEYFDNDEEYNKFIRK